MNIGGLLNNQYQARSLEHYNLTFIEINRVCQVNRVSFFTEINFCAKPAFMPRKLLDNEWGGMVGFCRGD